MKKCLILFDTNNTTHTFTPYNKIYNIIIITNNIYHLEYNANIIYPIKINNKSINILTELIKFKFNKINNIIINTTYPQSAHLFEQTNCTKLITHLIKNIIHTIYLIKTLIILLIQSNNPTINIILHEFNENKFLIESQCINNILINVMKTIISEYENITNLKINCFATNNINLLYKKTIYPYKNFKKNINIYNYLLKTKTITNKIIKL